MMPDFPSPLLLRSMIADTLRYLQKSILHRCADRLIARKWFVQPDRTSGKTRPEICRSEHAACFTVRETRHSRHGSCKVESVHRFEAESTYVWNTPSEALECKTGALLHLDRHRLLDLGQQGESNLRLRHARSENSSSNRRLPVLGIPWVAGGCSYGDFIIRVLPLIHEIDTTMRERSDDGAPLLLHGVAHTPWCKEFLALLSIPENRILPANVGYTIEPEGRLYFTSGCSSSSNIAHPSMLLAIRDAILCAVADVKASPIQRLYISRTSGRVMSNEAELLPGLRQRGFEIIRLEEHSVAEQIKMFSQADIIVGPHGAGHANILWARPGTKLFEVFHPAWKHPCYSILSSLVGASYHYMMSHGAPHKGHWNTRSRAGISLDVMAPPDLFFKALDQITESKAMLA